MPARPDACPTVRLRHYPATVAPRWERTPAGRLEVGDRARVRDTEITVSRIEHDFLGRAGMLAFIEDTPERWLKVPIKPDAEVEVLRQG